MVRRLIGYDRYESAEGLTLFGAIRQDWRLYVNFLQPALVRSRPGPVLKIIEKKRRGSKVRKRYSIARTPLSAHP